MEGVCVSAGLKALITWPTPQSGPFVWTAQHRLLDPTTHDENELQANISLGDQDTVVLNCLHYQFASYTIKQYITAFPYRYFTYTVVTSTN